MDATKQFCDEIWDMKYKLKDEHGYAIDLNRDDTFKRVAVALSDGDSDKEKRFLNLLRGGCIPGGRIIANAGAGKYKRSASLINCTVSSEIEDSIEGIMDALTESAKTLHTGAGIGYCFSSLRPKGSYVDGVGSYTSGQLSFMNIFDSMCATISSAGGRRGAQMGTMHCWHPDIFDFIKAKRKDGVLRKFNLSVLVTDSLIRAVKDDLDWKLWFPIYSHHPVNDNDEIIDVTGIWPFKSVGTKAKVYETIKARKLWAAIMDSTYEYAEPGVIFIDRVNALNPLNYCETITATNPCGEQPLPPNGACLLGSIDLTKCVIDPFTQRAFIDYDLLRTKASGFAELLDSVVEHANLPLKWQTDELETKRRFGMGVTGLGSALTMLGVRYGNHKSIEITDRIFKEIAIGAYLGSRDLAECELKWLNDYEMEVAKALDEIYIPFMVSHDGERYSNAPYNLILADELKKEGIVFTARVKNTHRTSVAPTGTISIAFCGNCSSGIEPSFAHSYTRNTVVEGRQTKVATTIESYEWSLYKRMYPEATVDTLPEYFVTSDSVTPTEHLKIQAVAQRWVDSSISKTINVPTDISREDFNKIYIDAYDMGCKGVTTYRYNPTVISGVLTRDNETSKTKYKFTLEDGKEVVCSGTDMVTYKDEESTAENLYNSLKGN